MIMAKPNNLGWIFGTDKLGGIPYLECPYCNRKVSGFAVIFSDIDYTKCPECEKDLNFDNITEDNWNFMHSYFGERSEE